MTSGRQPCATMKPLSSAIQTIFFGYLAFALSQTACAPEKDSYKTEMAKLQGTWRLVYQQSNGKKLPDEKTAEMFHGKMTFAGDRIRYTVDLPGFDFEITYMLHPDQQPKAIDLEVKGTSDKEGIGQKFSGIYIIEGDSLTICYSTTARPQGFSAGEGSPNTLIALKRKPS